MHGSSAGNPAPLTTFGGLVTLASPDSLPEGASPRLYDVDFIVGAVQTRDGTTSVYSYAGEAAGPNGADAAVSSAWSNPTNILLNDGSFTSIAAAAGGDLDVTEFAFALSSSISTTGFKVVLRGYSDSNTQIQVQLIVDGAAVGAPKSVTLPMALGAVTLGDFGDPWGASLGYADVNKTTFGIRISASSAFPLATAFLDYATVQVGITTANANFTYITTFVAQNGAVKNLSLDAGGDLWVEDVSNNPGVLNLALSGITPNSFANGINGPDVEYLAFNDLSTGSDIPRQYTPDWIDKITQVGPGQAPVFTPSTATTTTYAITSITQPAAHSQGFSYFLQSSGPGSTSPGNVVTVYYLDSTVAPGPDADLVAAFNSGNPTIIYTSFTGGPVTQGPYTQLVTSVGLGQPPGQPRAFYYYTYVLTTSVFTYYQGSGHAGYTANYQRSLATLTTAVPVPGLLVGSVITVTGSSVSAWDAAWPITQTLDSGSFAITSTSVASGVATYSYTVLSGVAPSAGQFVTVTGTLNAGGVLNVVNASIVSSTGGSSGTFTTNVSSPDFASTSESGQAITAGTIFAFDPGTPDLGSSTDPIFGDGAGGDLVFAGSGQFISPGTKQGSMFFVTRNGAWTFPAPPVTFDVPNNTTSIVASQMLIGPPDVIARGIILTESGQDGVPGGNFFTIPTPVDYTVLNVKYTASSLIVHDNTSTSATFTFIDSVLLNAEAVDVQGNNLFNLIEIGNPGWIVQYDSRNFYGLCQNKIQNCNNLSFDGGYLPGAQLVPSGWTTPDIYGQLLNSPVFGNSYYIHNTSGSPQAVLGLISQTAYQDPYQQPIIYPNTAYSVRVTARIPSGITTGNLVVELKAGTTVYGTYTLPFASMNSAMAIYTGTLLTTKFTTTPSNLMLNVYASAIADGADVEIDRIEPFDTAIPILTTTVYGSYANEPEMVDGVSGQGKFISENQQPVNGAVVMYDTFYALKESSMYSWQASPNLEPAQWNEPEVAQRAGACGINAYDFGEQWIVEACRNGLYLYEGGLPGKLTQEIFQVWDAINWSAKKCIWVKNDVKKRRLFVGVPMATPNFYLPNAPVNANPTSPNVILMCNYQGCETGDALKAEISIHTTMFGTLNATDMRRKWSIWQIPSPYGAFVKTATDEAFYLCNGQGNSKVYALDSAATTDDGVPINSLYTTYGFINPEKAAQYPMFGMFRKRIGYMTHTTSGSGNLRVRFLPNQLLGPADSTVGYRSWDVPGGFNLTPVCLNDREASVNFVATRSYVELSTSGEFNLSNLTLYGKKDTWNMLTGQK